MFGRRHPEQPAGGGELPVDYQLEQGIAVVEVALGTHLEHPGDDSRRDLLRALELLDQQIDQSDSYDANNIRSARYGTAPRSAVIGETRLSPLVQPVPSVEFQAQIALVKAAKREVTIPTPDTLSDLRAAAGALAAVRATGQEGRGQGDGGPGSADPAG